MRRWRLNKNKYGPRVQDGLERCFDLQRMKDDWQNQRVFLSKDDPSVYGGRVDINSFDEFLEQIEWESK